MSAYQTVLQSIIAQIEQGAGAYVMPWHATAAPFSLPVNVTTDVHYRGLNVLALWHSTQTHGFTSGGWATYKQWAAIGAQVRRGERGTACIKWKDISRSSEGADAAPRFAPLGFVLFNADQVDGWQVAEPAHTPNLVEARAAADAIIAAAGVPVVHTGQRAFYRPSTDSVVLPEQWRFRNTDAGDATTAYYSTALHEIIHATATAARCNREFATRYGVDIEARALEELVAELGAAFCCARLGLMNTPRTDHAPYVESWLKRLKSNPHALTQAASLAQAATDWLLNRLPAPSAITQLAA